MVIALVQVRSTVPQGVVAQVLPGPGGQLIGRLFWLRSWKFAAGCRRKSVVLQAQRIEQRIGGLAAAALDVGIVAVDMRLLELAQIEIALHRPMVAHGVAAVQSR